MVLEGTPIPKKNKDGLLRHSFGKGRITGDIGTQSLAIVSENCVILKNLAERSEKALGFEHKIHLLQRYIDRSMRKNNPNNYNSDGTIKKGMRNWYFPSGVL